MGSHEIAMIQQQLAYANKQQRYWNARIIQLQDALTDELESLSAHWIALLASRSNQTQQEVPGP